MTVIRGVHQWETLRSQTVLSWTETLHNKHVVRAAEKRKSLCEKESEERKREATNTLTSSRTPAEQMILAIITVFNLN